MTMLHRNKNLFLEFTINDENHTLNLSVLCNSYAKGAYSSSEFIFIFLYTGGNIQYAVQQFVLCVHLTFVNFTLHPTPQKNKSNGVKSEDSKGSLSVTVQNQTHIHTSSVSHNGRHHHLPQILNSPPESTCNYCISAIRDAKGFETFDRNVNPHRPLQNLLNYAAGTLSKSRRVETNSFH
jgi:hypothetical protein